MNRFEFNLIGCLASDVFWMRDPESLTDAMDIARREYFSTDLGKVIYSSVLQILQSDAAPDKDLIDQLLTNNDTYRNYDGQSVLADAVRNSKTELNAVVYARKIREEHFLRDAKTRFAEGLKILNEHGDAKNKIEQALNIAGDVSTDYDMARKDASLCDAIAKMIDRLEDVSSRGSTITGVDTGYARLNQITHGLQPGNTIVVAGVPGGGKTTFCMNIMAHAALEADKKVLFYSLEMPKHEIAMKLCSWRTGIQMAAFHTAEVATDDVKKEMLRHHIGEMKKDNLFIDDDPEITAETIENRTKQHAMKMGGIDLICVDYLTLMDAQGDNETTKAGNAAKSLKRLAKKFNCPVIIISQMVKNLTGRPTKADLRQTGQLGQDASLIMFLYKEENQVTESGQSQIVELIIDKNRMGETGSINLEPQFAINRMIETDREAAFPLDRDGNPIKHNKGSKLGRVA